jgi:integrase
MDKPVNLLDEWPVSQSELLGLFWSDLDWDGRKLYAQRQCYQGKLRELKTSSSRRVVTLGEVVLVKLRERQAHQAREREWGATWEESDLIFTSLTGKPIGSSNLRQTFASLVAKADLPKIRFHDLRHAAATLMLQRGIHPKVVQERLGHSSISMTLGIYSHVLPSLQEDVADRLDALLWLQ